MDDMPTQNRTKMKLASPTMAAATFVASNGNRYRLTRNLQDLNLKKIHSALSTDTYWASGIELDTVTKAFEHSMCFGVMQEKESTSTEPSEMVAFGRLVTDYTTFGYLSDVYVYPDHRGQGVGKFMIQSITQDEAVQGMRRLMLGTLDAHGLYQQAGFTPLAHPDILMEIYRGAKLEDMKIKRM